MGSVDRHRVEVDPRRHRRMALVGSQDLREAANLLVATDRTGRYWRVLPPAK